MRSKGSKRFKIGSFSKRVIKGNPGMTEGKDSIQLNSTALTAIAAETINISHEKHPLCIGSIEV